MWCLCSIDCITAMLQCCYFPAIVTVLQLYITDVSYLWFGCYSHVTVMLQSCYCITELMKEPVLQDKRLQHVKFCRCASELMLQSCYCHVTALQSWWRSLCCKTSGYNTSSSVGVRESWCYSHVKVMLLHYRAYEGASASATRQATTTRQVLYVC